MTANKIQSTARTFTVKINKGTAGEWVAGLAGHRQQTGGMTLSVQPGEMKALLKTQQR